MARKWKKSIRKISDSIRDRSESLGPEINVGLVKRITLEELALGVYAHLGLSLSDGHLMIESDEIKPSRKLGLWAKRNLEGWVQKHKDLPKESYTIEYLIPHFGDWSKGSHLVSFNRQRYPRTFHPAKFISFKIDEVAQDISGEAYLIRFRANRSIQVGSRNWLENLFFQANLFQESIGGFDVYSTAASVDDYLSTISVTWQIFPAGDSKSVLRVVGARSVLTAQEREQLQYRLDILSSLDPKHFVVGTQGFEHYIGAIVRDDVVVFENAEYGNAIYVMNQHWKALSQMSRTELLASLDNRVTRIVHTKGWEARLFHEVSKRLAS